MNYTFRITVSALVLIAGGVVAHATFPYHPSAMPVTTAITPVGSPHVPTPVDGSVTVDGELVCLPQRAGGQELTLECAVGLRTSEGKHYALENINPYIMEGKVAMGQWVKVTGRLRSDRETRYDAIGTIDAISVDKLDQH